MTTNIDYTSLAECPYCENEKYTEREIITHAHLGHDPPNAHARLDTLVLLHRSSQHAFQTQRIQRTPRNTQGSPTAALQHA